MMVCRVLSVVTLLAILLSSHALAQFGGMPGMPGSPGFGGGAPGGRPGGAFGAPSGPPPECQQIMAARDDTEKHGKAIQSANKRKASPQEACGLFKSFIAAEVKFMRLMKENGPRCGAPPDVLKQISAGHTRAETIAKQVCDVAAQGPRPVGPSLSDALGASTTVPDSQGKRGGTFDTLTGNALTR
jgi:hypothetical protein